MKTTHSNSAESTNHERNLFARISNDDASAFTELFNTYSIRLASYVDKIFNSAMWSEEIVQDVFLKLWTGRNQLKKVDNPSAYIYRMAANRALDLIKKHQLEIKLQYHIAKCAANEKNNFTEELADFHFSEKLFNSAITNLPPQQMIVYRLRHEEGLGYDEIKDRLKISKNTVRNQLVAALDNIRNYLLRHEAMLAGFLTFLSLKLFFSAS